MSNTASACGKLSRARFAYRPVFGDRKSGMPALVLTPAPVMKTTFLTLSLLRYSATASRLRAVRVEGGVSSSMGFDSSFPILRLRLRPVWPRDLFLRGECFWFGLTPLSCSPRWRLCLRPILKKFKKTTTLVLPSVNPQRACELTKVIDPRTRKSLPT